MAVEDHPLFPKWKEAVERLIEAKARMNADAPDAKMRQNEYDKALYDYTKIAENL